MPVTTDLFAYGLRQVLGVSEESLRQVVEGVGTTAEASGPVGKIIALVRRHFTDHSQTLPRALQHANERAWQALDRTVWRAKNTDTFKPMGPWIETEVSLPDLTTRVYLNEKLVSELKDSVKEVACCGLALRKSAILSRSTSALLRVPP